MRALSMLALAVVLTTIGIAIAVDVKAAAVVVAKKDDLLHNVTNSAFFTLTTDGLQTFAPTTNGWAPIAPTQAAAATSTSTTPKKTFSISGNSTSAGNWIDGNGVPAGVTLTFDAQFTISALPNGSVLTNPGNSTANARGNGIGVTQVAGGVNDINTGNGLHFSPVAVSNVSFTGTLAEPGFNFTPGGVSGFGTILFRSGNFDEDPTGTSPDGMLLTQGADTIGFGTATGTIASNLLMDNNFGPPGTSSLFPRQSGPYTLVVTQGTSVIKGMTLQYDVTYDVSASTGVDADFDGDGDVDGADFLSWQQNVGTAAGATPEQGDADGNGAVDGLDLAAWQGSFGAGAALPATAAIPEPATAALAAIGLLMAAGRKRA